MKKLILFAALALSLPVFAQHSRRVLIEEFTQASCGPCAANNPAFNATLAQREDIITPIKYQTSWPGVDPMNAQNPSEVATRVTYYAVSGVPDAWQNGTVSLGTPGAYTVGQIDDEYNNNVTPVTMTAIHNITDDLDSVYTTITVTSDIALTGTLRLRVAVVEDEILFNKAPGSNGEKEFYQIMRKMLPNAAGTTTGNFAAGETKTYTFAWKLAYIYNLNEVGVSAWLQDDASKEIWQSARSMPNTNIEPLGISIASGNKLACIADSPVSFTLTNTSATPLTSAKLRYRIGTGAWTSYDWTGNIAGGASSEETLPGVILPNTGLTKVDIEALESNNGVQTNMVGAVSTLNYKALTAAATLPLAADFQTVILPATWTVFNAGTNGWKGSTPGSGSTRSAKCNMFDIPAGDDTYLISPKLDMSTATNTSILLFDHAYAYYDDTFFDSLRIEVSINCGNTWATVFNDGYTTLATSPAKTTAFTPTASQWQTGNAIDMTAYNGNSEVLVRFVGVSGFGNNLYLDNINLSTSVGVQQLNLNGFKVQPNPTQDLSRVSFNLPAADDIQVSVFNATGLLVQTQQLGNLVSGTHNVDLDAARLPSGSYRVVLQGNTGLAQLQWVVIK